METEIEAPVGICPACRETVFNSREPDGPVWTCPADLNPRNPYWEPRTFHESDEEHEKACEEAGVFSNCGEDFGFGCYERLPLHADCYERGNY